MRACKRCRYALPEKMPNDEVAYSCCFFPPSPQGARPLMKAAGWCGQFKLSLRRLLFGHGA